MHLDIDTLSQQRWGDSHGVIRREEEHGNVSSSHQFAIHVVRNHDVHDIALFATTQSVKTASTLVFFRRSLGAWVESESSSGAEEWVV